MLCNEYMVVQETSKTCCAVMVDFSRRSILSNIDIPVLKVEILKLITGFSVSHVNSVENWSS